MEISKKIRGFVDSNHTPLIIFFSSLFLFISFGSTRLFFSDEGVILNQFYNLLNGSLALESFKIDTTRGVFIIVENHIYGKFSYSLLILSLPAYSILRMMDILYSAHLFILNVWALSGAFIVYLTAKTRNMKFPLLDGAIAYSALIAINMPFFKNIYFPVWGELLSIEFTNILISSFFVLLVYLLFRNLFSNKTAIFASFFLIFATPVSFYAVTLKHHALSLFLTISVFYLFYKYQEKKDTRYIYLAYASAAFCIWTRTLDGAVLLASLLIMDLITDRRIKHIAAISTVIIISLTPFFAFNYLILGHPFSIMETVPLIDKPVEVQIGKDFIKLGENLNYQKQADLLNVLGYGWNTDIKTGWQDVLLDITFLRTVNTFGVFLVSPFTIIALAFVIEVLKHRMKLNTMDRILGLYILLVFAAYGFLNGVFNMNYLTYIIRDTPMALEYRYLLIIYIIFFYFALRVNRVKDLIEDNFNKIIVLYGSILIFNIIYFIKEFPIPFMNIYYHAALTASILLIIAIMPGILARHKTPVVAFSDKLLVLTIALSLALASSLLLFYYWIVNMTYISPSQNHAILPVLENTIKWMYQAIF